MRQPVREPTETHAPGWWLIHVDIHGDATASGPPVADLDAAMVGAAIILGREPAGEVHILSTRAGGGRTTLRGAAAPG